MEYSRLSGWTRLTARGRVGILGKPSLSGSKPHNICAGFGMTEFAPFQSRTFIRVG